MKITWLKKNTGWEKEKKESNITSSLHPSYITALPVCGGQTVYALEQNTISTYRDSKFILSRDRKSYKHILGVKNEV